MSKLREHDAHEVLRQARAHMDPTVFDRARVARKLSQTCLTWDGQSGVHGTTLPAPPGPAGQVAAGALTAGKIALLKWPAWTLASLLAVGGATLGLHQAQSPAPHAVPHVAPSQPASSEPRSARLAQALPAPAVHAAAPSAQRAEQALRTERAAPLARDHETSRSRAPVAADHAPNATPPAPLPPAATPLPPVTAPVQAPPDPLLLDIALLKRAAQALHAGETRRAQALLEEHAQRFAASETRYERHALAFQAACALGEREIAERHRSALLREVPQSPLAARVRGGCVDGRP